MIFNSLRRSSTASAPPARSFFLGLLLTLFPIAAFGELLMHVVQLQDGSDLPVAIHPAPGPVLIWFPSEHGVLEGHHTQAARLSDSGIEVWLPDPFAAFFLPNTPSSFDRLPVEPVPRLIEAAHELHGRPVYAFGNDRAAPWLLEGLRLWQSEHPGAGHFAGLLLMSPYLHTGLPDVGEEPVFHPVARATNLPIYLMQPVLSPQYPLLAQVRALLTEGGSDVAVRVLPEVRDRFFFRPNTLPAEDHLRLEFASELLRGLRLLARLEPVRVSPSLGTDTIRFATATRQDRTLEPTYTRLAAPPLRLPELGGALLDLEDHRGEVVLVNFWASWCPPCVHEMPSMQRLEDRLRDQGFRILAVNLGESESTVREFLKVVDTRFAILMDPQRSSLEHWRAMAYPTSYLVDRQGRISHYLFGAIEWNEPGVVAQITELLRE